MANTDNETNDTSHDTEQIQPKDPKDLEPEKDVKGGGWPFGSATTTQAPGPRG
jgi:hypothetical protein